MRADMRTSDGTEPRRIAYRPELDGLRALAVVAVLVFHHSEMLIGGFLGVDVFFVLSGFLITSLLVAEREATGRIDLADFWRRRARRLLPAVFLLMLMVAAIAAWVLPESASHIRRDGIATILYVENWHRIAARPPTHPLGHAWSLSIEEQWYLVWPVLFGVVVSRARGRLLVAAGAAGGAAIASAVAMVLIYGDGAGRNRAYLGTDTRAQGLLVGAALALLLAHRTPRLGRGRSAVLEITGGAAVAVLAVLMFRADVHDAFFYRGGFLLVAVAVATVIFAATSSGIGWLRRVLAWRPLVAIGLVSYGLYLFHLPVYTWLTPRRTDLDRVPLLVARLAVTGIVAVASYRFVERPVRTGAWRGRATLPLAAGAAALVVVVLLVATRHEPLTPEQARLAYAMGIAGDRAPDGATRIAVLGGNAAFGLAVKGGVHDGDGFRGVAWGRIGCGLAKGAPIVNGVTYPPPEHCARWPEQFELVVDRFDADVAVLLAGDSEAFDRVIDGTTVPLRSPALDRHLKGRLDRARTVLDRGDTRFVLALPAPCGGGTATPASDLDAIRDLWREWATARDVDVVDFADFLCVEGAPGRTRTGAPILDEGSFTPEGARAAWDWIASATTAGSR